MFILMLDFGDFNKISRGATKNLSRNERRGCNEQQPGPSAKENPGDIRRKILRISPGRERG
jgi:hypothetical protein